MIGDNRERVEKLQLLFFQSLANAPSLDENGYICTKHEAIKAFDAALFEWGKSPETALEGTMSHFTVGDRVEKYKGEYTGPGIVRGVIILERGIRYLVGHQIAGGDGEFLHIYSTDQIRRIGDQS